MPDRLTRRMRVWIGYLLLAAVLTWPLALRPLAATVGFANVDALDTLTLRGLVAGLDPREIPWSKDAFYPVGYPVLALTPNALDHLTGAPFAWLLPFPLSDNLWWILVLSLNGLCAHRLGRRLGGTEAAGALAGVAFLLSEAVAREANLHHAPQAMAFWAPLYLDALLSLREDPAPRRAALAGLWLAAAGWSYWYFALFLGFASLPLLWGVPLRAVGALGGTAAALAAPGLAPWLWLWDQIPLAGMSPPPPAKPPASFGALPEGQQFIAQHGNDLLFWLRRAPMDVSNRASLALLAAAVVGASQLPRPLRWRLWSVAAIGAIFLLGPALRWGGEIALVGGRALSLPFAWLADLHPLLARLTWPERWGILVPLALAALAARAPRPAIWAAAIAAEGLLVSANMPLQTLSLRNERCWADLSHARGAILELPLRRPGLRMPRVGVHRRYHGRPVVNPLLLPPGVDPPAEWTAWRARQPLLQYIDAFEAGKWPPDPGADAVRALQAAGVSAIALDVEPGVMLTEGQRNRYQAGLGKHFGPPIDLGCAWVWWLDAAAPPPAPHPDPVKWREEAAEWSKAHPEPDLDTLIQPSWDAVDPVN